MMASEIKYEGNIQVHISVVVQASGEPCPLIVGNIIINFFFRQPGGQDIWGACKGLLSFW